MNGPRDSVVEVQFETDDPSYPFVDLSASQSCRVELLTLLPRERDEFAEFFAVSDADPGPVLERASERDPVTPHLLSSNDGKSLFEFEVTGECPAKRLAEIGAVPHEVVGDRGEGRLQAFVPPRRDATDVVDSFLAEHSSISLTRKRSLSPTTGALPIDEFGTGLHRRLSTRQREVLRTAYEAGYFEEPRETTGKELADELDITSATFSQHLRAAERVLLSMLDEEDAL